METNRLKTCWAAIPVFVLLACTSVRGLGDGQLPVLLVPAIVDTVPDNVGFVSVADFTCQQMVEAACELDSSLYGRRYGDAAANTNTGTRK